MKRISHGECSRGSIHQLRIDCRRAEAILRLCRGGVAARPRRWLQGEIRGLRRACNSVRDDDVVRQWLAEPGRSSKQLRRNLLKHRRRQIPGIRAQCRELLEANRFAKCSRRLLRDIGRMVDAKTGPAMVFGRGISRELSLFIQAIPEYGFDDRKAHQLRIAAKRLRYAVEAIREIWPDLPLENLRELVHSCQTQLGAVRDAIVREQRLRDLSGCRQNGRGKAFRREEQAARTRAFREWWNAQPMETVIGDAMAAIVALIRNDPLSRR